MNYDDFRRSLISSQPKLNGVVLVGDLVGISVNRTPTDGVAVFDRLKSKGYLDVAGVINHYTTSRKKIRCPVSKKRLGILRTRISRIG